jgi:GNAT superfamily N-acetyltransferase
MDVGSVPDEIVLRDGTHLVVRPIRPTDADALVALHARLSADTIYRRYFGARPHLAPADVDRFTRVDGRVRFALVAMRASDLVAVARYEGRPDEPSAELAVVVDDVLQHQGVGRLLLQRLLDVAREAGLGELAADVLIHNAPMLSLLRALDLPRRTETDGDTVTVHVNLAASEPSPQRRQRALRHLAQAGPAVPPQ